MTLIKSKKRVKENGEVFTPQFIVHKMCDELYLNDNTIFNIDKTFLEPAVGEGVFLVEILKRKLNQITHSKHYNYKQAKIAVASIYGVDISYENVVVCSLNLYQTIIEDILEKFPKLQEISNKKEFQEIIDKNIIQGNFLTKKLYDEVKSFHNITAKNPTKILEQIKAEIEDVKQEKQQKLFEEPDTENTKNDKLTFLKWDFKTKENVEVEI